CGYLQVGWIALHRLDGDAGELRNRRIVGELKRLAGRGLVGGVDRLEAESLRRLGGKESLTRDGRHHRIAFDRFERIDEQMPGQNRLRLVKSRDDARQTRRRA